MLQPIHIEHEICCPSCGCVLGTANESTESERSLVKPNVNIHLLGSALETNVKLSLQRTPQVVFEERTLKLLSNITKQFGLPESFALETFNELKRKKRGFQSETFPIKQLLQILSKDDNYGFFYKTKKLKEYYKNIGGK